MGRSPQIEVCVALLLTVEYMGSKPTELNNEIMKRSKYYFKAKYKGDEFPDEQGSIIDVADWLDDPNEPGYVFRFPDGSEHDNMHDEDWEPLNE